MKRFLISDVKKNSAKTKNYAEDEKLRKRVRRAIKNIAVSDDLETKVLNLIRKKITVTCCEKERKNDINRAVRPD